MRCAGRHRLCADFSIESEQGKGAVLDENGCPPGWRCRFCHDGAIGAELTRYALEQVKGIPEGLERGRRRKRISRRWRWFVAGC